MLFLMIMQKVKVDTYDIIILIKLVLNKDKNHYYYNILLEKDEENSDKENSNEKHYSEE